MLTANHQVNGASGIEPTCQNRIHRDPGLVPGLGRFPGEGNGNLLQYSCLENSIERGGWQTAVHGLQRVGHD